MSRARSPADRATEPVEVGIESIAAGGDGVGRLDDGRVIFVPRTAPGDRVRARVVRDRGRWLRGEVVALLEESDGRRAPPCPLFESCGGCQLQHLPYRLQLEAKSRRIGDALRRIGGLDVADPPVEAAPDEFRYRNRMAFSLRRLRGGRAVAGLHDRIRPGRIVDVAEECLLPEPRVGEAWAALRREWGRGARLLPPGRELRLTLRGVEGGALLAIDGGRPGGDAPELVERVSSLQAIWHRTAGEPWRLLAGSDACVDRIAEHRFRVGPEAFAQINGAVAARIQRAVLQEMGRVPGARIVDAYCGVGLYGRRLAVHGAQVVGLELDPGAASVAREEAPDGFTVVEGATEATLESVLPADRVILNPPRVGLHARVPELLREARPERIVYVSCDPSTLARDIARLGDGFRLRRVAAFDLFPQTAHVETVVTLDAVSPTNEEPCATS
ncbi:MAG: TRAM domain-containing protein [Gemmatimonadetes bacterium]|nr:TRAM domain-containing protein [Gemmatimonadota bacterium]NNF37371.1 class I SAM-dependent RNA methyltransferase [Gemmatimonadota bacterium]